MERRYIVFDVETPNRNNDRMSAIGVSVIENGRITGNYYTLVNPETRFDRFNVRLTGINEEITADAPTFPQVWEKIRPVMESGILVAHNAVFDLGVLKCCLRDYDIEWKPYVHYMCTVQMGRKLLPGMKHNLDTLCGYFNIGLNHHHAGSDSSACAEILLRYLGGGAGSNDYIRTYSFNKVKEVKMADFKYEIVEEIGVLSENSKGWRKELNKISWNDAPAKYDIRDWAPDRAKMGKGITLTEEEAMKLKELL